MWNALTFEYTNQSIHAQAYMRSKFLTMKCPHGADVREFLDMLREEKRKLIQCGVTMDNKDYLSTIVQSLPGHLSGYANAQLDYFRMAAQGAALASGIPLTEEQLAAANRIDPEVLMHMVAQEADRRKRERTEQRAREGAKLNPKQSKPKDESLAVESGKRKDSRTCYNCGKKGHISRVCRSPKREKTKPEEKAAKVKESAKTLAHAVSDPESEDDWVLATMEDDTA